jgi:hypothetical protein
MELDEYKHTYPFSSVRAAHHANYMSKYKLKFIPMKHPVLDKEDDPIVKGELTSISNDFNAPVNPPTSLKNKLLTQYRGK